MDYSTTAWNGVVLEFGYNNFLNIREQLGTQEEVAKLLGIKYQQTISEIECGNSKMDNRTYSVLCLLADKHPGYELVGDENLNKLVVEYEGAEKLKQLRKNAKLLQKEVASKLKLTDRRLIGRYENNKQNPSDQCYTLFLLITNQHPYFSILPRLG